MALAGYSLANCFNTASHAFGPSKMRTPRTRPSLSALRSARSERAICDGLLGMGCNDIQSPPKSRPNLKFRIIVSPNACTCAALARTSRNVSAPPREKAQRGLLSLSTLPLVKMIARLPPNGFLVLLVFPLSPPNQCS